MNQHINQVVESSDEMAKKYLQYRMQQSRSLLGQKPESIQKFIVEEQEKMSLALKKMQDEPNLRGDEYYFGSVSVNFIICRGHVSSTVTFGDGNEWEFSADFWGGGAGSSTGAGMSIWGDGFTAPYQNQKMSFELTTVGLTAGMIQMFWWGATEGISGSLMAAGASVGFAAGGGEGTWRKK